MNFIQSVLEFHMKLPKKSPRPNGAEPEQTARKGTV